MAAKSAESGRSRFPESTLVAALERSVRASRDLRAVESATVQSARVLARRIDADPDSVTASMMQTFLKYCQSLGFTLDARPGKDDGDGDSQGKRGPTPMERFLESRKG